MGDSLPAVDLGAGRYAVRVSCGEMHSCALLDDGSVKCWGSGAAGQLGLGDTSAPGGTRGSMGEALPQVIPQCYERDIP
jgi:E3 ubiquitin-protein ligase HERC3